jgi:hypothetical protein
MARSKKLPKKPKGLVDPWISKYSPIEPKKLHALGAITLAWNTCETHLLMLFIVVARITPPRAGWIISHDLGSIALSERIAEIAKLRTKNHPEEADNLEAILHALKVYDDCRQNRNSLTHFKLQSDPSATELNLVRMKGPSMEQHPLPDQLSDFRRVVEEIRALSANMRLLWKCLDARYNGTLPPLPEKLPRRELIWKPPRQVPKVHQPPLSPSAQKPARWKSKQ